MRHTNSGPSLACVRSWPHPRAMRLSERLRRQVGVVSREQVLEAGYSPSFIYGRLASLKWSAMAPGVYLTTGTSPTVTQTALAAVLSSGTDSMVTGTYAMHMHGVRIEAKGPVQTLIPHERRQIPNHLVHPIRVREMPRPFGRDVPYAPLARAVCDACRSAVSLDQIRAMLAPAVQQRMCSVEALTAEIRTQGKVNRLLKEGINEIVAGVRSVPEARLRKLIVSSRLPEPLWNPRIFLTNGAFLACPDAYWPAAGFAVEVQSREWHLNPGDHEKTLARIRRMMECGIVVMELTPREIETKSAELLREIGSALAAASKRTAPRFDLRPAH